MATAPHKNIQDQLVKEKLATFLEKWLAFLVMIPFAPGSVLSCSQKLHRDLPIRINDLAWSIRPDRSDRAISCGDHIAVNLAGRVIKAQLYQRFGRDLAQIAVVGVRIASPNG